MMSPGSHCHARQGGHSSAGRRLNSGGLGQAPNVSPMFQDPEDANSMLHTVFLTHITKHKRDVKYSMKKVKP